MDRNIENEEFAHNVSETFKQCGPIPLIGTFDPQIGDIGHDSENFFYIWDGSTWAGKTKNPQGMP